MQISIEDFRCFHEPNPVDIRSINILVGENSAGKTSFLAATRFMLDLFDRTSRASFNKDPFNLGSYENIAHYRGGRFGRAQSFSFVITGVLSTARQANRHPDLFEGSLEGSRSDYELRVKFIDQKSQPAIHHVSFSVGSYGFELQYRDRIQVIIRTPNLGRLELENDFPISSDERSSIDLSFVDIMLRSFAFRYSREGADESVRARHLKEVTLVRDLYLEALRTLPSNVYASAPVRSRPERTYNPTDFAPTPDGGHMPFVLAQLNYFDPQKWERIKGTLAEFGRSSGLFEDVSIRKIGNSTGGPFQIIVNMKNRKSNLIDVGYGVSQALPIVTDILRSERRALFLFQQPEVHLHPRAQAALGTFFAQIVRRRQTTLFIETHSDHLIDRIRMHVRDGQFLKPSDVNILYFEREGHDVSIHKIDIDKQGNLIGAPPGYRRFFLEEEMKSLGVEFENAVNN